MIDTRTFIQLNEDLPREDCLRLRTTIIKKASITSKAYDHWRFGRRNPLPIFQDLIAKEVRRMGYKVTAKTLFPRPQ